ncbi:hypothetical protein ACGFI9_14945 [Micromonospora sp. NPDC048930]|uniref:hypothetical protein n=1 Tax=Micromonospora sp. NPDC048930 TaxID=3364261 RepID=UPI00371ED1AC
MNRARPHRGLTAALALTLGVTGLAVISTGGTALAAPHYASSTRTQLGWTDSATPKTAYDEADHPRDNLPIGTWPDATGVPHTSRIYATFDLSAFKDKKIYDGKVYVQEVEAADCTKKAFEIWRTEPVDGTPTWQHPPKPLAKLDEKLTASQYCPGGTPAFDVASAVRDAVAEGQSRITFEIRVPERYETDPAYARRFYWYYGVRLSVQYNSVPRIDNTNLYNGGFACGQATPYRRLGGLADILQALGRDADEYDQGNLHTEVAIWPANDPSARQVFQGSEGSNERVGTVKLPSGTLVDDTSYTWQARISDGTDSSEWSKKCSFTYDATDPSIPTVTSPNYPRGGDAPVGEPGIFTFSGNGDPDVAGFQYGWNGLGISGICSIYGDVGQYVCGDPLEHAVRADDNGIATLSLSPPRVGWQALTVRSIDLAGNVSDTTTYEVIAGPSDPRVEVVGPEPEWNKEVTLKFTPYAGVSGVTEYEYTVDGGETKLLKADADGTARLTFTATNVDGAQVTVRSHSANGFVSTEGNWMTVFYPWPGVKSDVYYYPEDGHAVGGVGVEGTFTFSPPAGWADVAAYRYSFLDGGDLTEVAAGAGGRATITWTPTTSGYVTLTVYAVRADGTMSDYANWYWFEVA